MDVVEAATARAGSCAHADEALLDAARAGDDVAFTGLYRRHIGAARQYAARRCRAGAAADDAVATAFAAVFRAILNGGGPTIDFKPYLLAAIRNAIVDEARRRAARAEVVAVDGIDAEVVACQAPDDTTLGSRMCAALDALPDRQRRALWDTEVEGRTNDEMARRLELSSNAFAALKKRARRNLAAAYAEQVAGSDVCAWVGDRIGRYATGDLTRGDELLVDLHAEQCAPCASLLPDRSRTKVALLGLPLLLAAPIAAGRGRRAAAGARGATAAKAIGARAIRSWSIASFVAVVSAGIVVVAVVDTPSGRATSDVVTPSPHDADAAASGRRVVSASEPGSVTPTNRPTSTAADVPAFGAADAWLTEASAAVPAVELEHAAPSAAVAAAPLAGPGQVPSLDDNAGPAEPSMTTPSIATMNGTPTTSPNTVPAATASTAPSTAPATVPSTSATTTTSATPAITAVVVASTTSVPLLIGAPVVPPSTIAPVVIPYVTTTTSVRFVVRADS
jgi:RNA polymerase sigma factor (sigma-70 family)